jgi:hypothetical protein
MAISSIQQSLNCGSRCDAIPTDLDGPESHCRSHKKTDFLIKNFDPGILWDDFSIYYDIVVCLRLLWLLKLANVILSAFYTWLSAGGYP